MMRSTVIALVIWAVAFATPAVHAHEVRPAYLELTQTAADTFDVIWKIPARGEMRLRLYVSLPESTEIVGQPRGMFSNGAYIERWSIVDADALVGSTIRIDGLATTLTDVLVRIARLDGSTQVERLTPENPSLVVDASPNPWSVSRMYLVMGVEHILFGIDHLLFVLALLLLVKGWKRVVGTITAFTVAHSVTLALATLGFLHVPGPPVEAIIALSIVFVAGEIIHGRRGRPGLAARRPWIIAFAFGLLHGLGFASALGDIGLPQQAIPLSLLLFNVGVEVGQLLFIAGMVAVAAIGSRLFARRHARPDAVVQVVRPAIALLSAYAIGGVAMFWVIERVVGF